VTTPNDVIRTFGKGVTNLKVSLLEDDAGGLVLVEGGPNELRFLGQLLLALAEGGDDGFHIDPRGAGSAYFDPTSAFGVYIHRRAPPTIPVSDKPE
jgi:hypothetical protein